MLSWLYTQPSGQWSLSVNAPEKYMRSWNLGFPEFIFSWIAFFKAGASQPILLMNFFTELQIKIKSLEI
jgi:hypothetical protein